MNKPKITVVSGVGDPATPKTWSATPHNLCNAFIKNGYVDSVYVAGRNNRLFILITNVLKAFYMSRYYSSRHQIMINFRYKFLRYFYSFSAVKYGQRKNSDKRILHFSTSSIPFFKKPQNQRHYTYIDSTWNLWAKNATNINLIKNDDQKKIEQLEIKSFNQIDHIFSISEYVKKNLISHYHVDPQKISVVGTGTGIIQPFYGQKDYGNGQILFAAKGRFEDKGGNLVLDAFEKALKTNPDLRLSIVGQNDYSDKINHPNITTYGFIPLDQLQDLFNTHSVFLMPAYNEPWGLVYIEALLCKMPIIGLNINSFPELSGHGAYGIGIDLADANVISDELCKLLANPLLIQQLGEAGQEYALENYTWNQVAKKIYDVVEKDFAYQNIV